jgi:membrane protein
MQPKSLLKKIKETFSESLTEALDDKFLKMSAALSYYTVFSIGPLFVLVLFFAGFFFNEEAASGQIFSELKFIIGSEGAKLLQDAIIKIGQLGEGILATIISFLILAFGAMGVFMELKESLNIIWGVEARPGVLLKSQIGSRLLSFSLIVVLGFLLIVSLILSAGISAAIKFIGSSMPFLLPVILIADHLIIFIILTLAFTLIFKYLPSVKVKWRYAWQGGLLTSFLFNLGKFLIGWYISSSAIVTSYGAAGSFILILLWIYYTGLIFFFGAEFAQIWRRKFDQNLLVVEFDAVQVKKQTFVIKEALENEKKGNQNQSLFK